MKEPKEPEDLPEYILSPVKRQKPGKLERLKDYLEALIEYKKHIDFDEVDKDIPDRAQTALKQSTGPTYLLEMVKCGKDDCGSCPHGPYIYGYQREGSSIKSWYIGKPQSNPEKAEKAIETKRVKENK